MQSTDSIPVPEGAPDTLRLGVCRSLLEWSFEEVKAWTGGREKESGELILITIFARSARTYEATVRWLGERAFGEQGLMLNRSLFEDMIDAHWMAMNKELAPERLLQHDLYSRLLRADVWRRFPRFFDGRPPAIKVTNAERKELRRLFGRSGSGSWTGVSSLEERVGLVKGKWGDQESQEELLWWSAWVNKLSNEVLHPSAFAIARVGSPMTSKGTLEWHFGGTPEWLGQALHGAFWNYCQLIGLMIEEFAPEARAEFQERFRSGTEAFRRAASWERTGRLEDPPPIG